jgi:predicted MFS family arabinose efflux permease
MLLALGFATVVLVSTPFLIPEIASEYDVGLTTSSLIGVFQLGGFAIGSWVSGRFLTPNRSVLITALVMAIVANLLSASLPPIAILLALRLASGLSIGTITWFAWANAFGQKETMSRVAVVGPIIAVGATPGVAAVIGRFGIAGLFLLLAVLPLVPLTFARGVPTGVKKDEKPRNSAVTTARIVLVALTLFSLGGSAVFTFGVTIAARELGLAASTAAIGYTANAVVSIPSAGWKGRRTIPSPWMAGTALCAFLLATSFSTPVFFVAITAWGFCYWMAIPGVFDVLANASAYPQERAGDAQAMMAIGRVGGPLIGGLLLDKSGPLALGLVGSALMLSAAAAIFAVREATTPD